MALEDLIAEAGPQMFESMRKGWLPNQEERQAKSLKDLQIQEAQQKVASEPERQSYLKQRRKADLITQEQTTKLFDEKMKKYKTEEQVAQKTTHLDYASRITRGAFNVMGVKGEGIDQARTIFRDNLEGLLEANDKEGDIQIKKLIDPETSDSDAIKMIENFNAILPLAQEALDKQRISVSKRKNTLYEILKERQRLGTLDDTDQRKLDKLSGKTSSEKFDKTLKYKSAKAKEEALLKSRDTAKADMKHITNRNNAIEQAFQALESGDNTLSDKLLTAALANLTDSDVRAFKMYEVFDSSIGNIAERLQDWLDRGISGTRDEEQKNKIRTVLKKMQAYSQPVMKRMREQQRSIAKADGHDPYRVVPPISAKEIKDADISEKRKIELFREYPHLWKEIKNAK